MCFLWAAAAAGEIPTLELIMSDPDWIGNAPEGPWWSDDGAAVYYRQKRTGEDIRDVFRLALDTGQPNPVDRSATPADSGRDRVYSPQRTHAAWIDDGDVFLKQLSNSVVKQVTRTVEDESSPRFDARGQRLFFQRDGQFHALVLQTGEVRQLTDLRSGKDPDEEPGFDALRAQQLRIYATVVEDRRREEAVEDAEREARSDRPPPIYLGEDYEVVTRHLSPAGDRLALVVTEAGAEAGRAGQMPNYVTDDGYVAVREVRTRVGRNSAVPQRVVLVSLSDGARTPLDFTSLPGMDSDPFEALRESAKDWHVERGANPDEVAKALEAPEHRSVTVERLALTSRWCSTGSATRPGSTGNTTRSAG